VTLQVSQENKERSASAAVVAILHVLLGYAFLTGLGFRIGDSVDEGLELFDVTQEPVPPPVTPARPDEARQKKRPRPKDPEGAASPPNKMNTPTEIVAPEPKIPVTPPIDAAPIAGQGTAPAAGAAPVVGPGTGRGGQGIGLGSGTQGNGTGGGGGGGLAVHARWISGRIREEDYPGSALRGRSSGTVRIRFVVAPSGRVSQCMIIGSSGSSALDETTCRLIRSRFRYRPARDYAGRPIAETIRGEHEWDLGPEPPPVEVEPQIVDD
jgi:protein TonB